jgi:hypothetical protein
MSRQSLALQRVSALKVFYVTEYNENKLSNMLGNFLKKMFLKMSFFWSKPALSRPIQILENYIIFK